MRAVLSDEAAMTVKSVPYSRADWTSRVSVRFGQRVYLDPILNHVACVQNVCIRRKLNVLSRFEGSADSPA